MSRVTPARRSAEDRLRYRVPGLPAVPALLRLGQRRGSSFSRPIASDGCGFAKVLAFTYLDLRAGLNAAEHAISDLTAITEDGLDLQDEGVAFALATLQDSDITIARAANCRKSPSALA